MANAIKCLLVSGLLCLSNFVAFSPLQAEASPELSLSPEEGQVGDAITVVGTGFAVVREVAISFTGDEMITSPENVTTDESGIFSAEFEVPYFTSSGSVVIEVVDNSDNATSATVEFMVINTVPVADQLPIILVEENEPEVIELTASDDNGDTLILLIVDEPMHGNLSEFDEDTGEVAYTPDDGYNGQDSFSFKANDGVDDSITRIVNITISGVNDQPIAFDKTVEVDENSKKKITLEASDADEDILTYSIVSDPDHGNLTGTAPNLFYEPEEGYTGSDSLRFTVSDSDGISNVATVSIFVFADDDEDYFNENEGDSDESEYDYANSKPIAHSQSVTGTEDEPVQILLSGEDPDDDPLLFEIFDYPLHGEISSLDDTGELTYLPAGEYSGTDSFTFVAKDHQKESRPATISISISAVNDAPKPVSMNLTATDGIANFTLGASDAEGDLLQFTIYSSPANGTLAGTLPDLFYVADPDFTGFDKFLFTVTDNRTETWIGVISILVKAETIDEASDVDEQEDNDLENGASPDLDVAEESASDIEQLDKDPGKDASDEESTSKARADKSNVLVMVSWDHHKQQNGVQSELHLKFAEHRTREPLGGHIWYDLVMLDDSDKEILTKYDLVALDSEDTQQITFPADGTYHFEVNVKGLIDKSNNAVSRDIEYTGTAMGTVVVPEFNALGILLTFVAIMSTVVVIARRKYGAVALS